MAERAETRKGNNNNNNNNNNNGTKAKDGKLWHKGEKMEKLHYVRKNRSPQEKA
jgi:hypothetical protein